MAASMETRWFYRHEGTTDDPVPSDVRSWFASSEEPEKRDDHYLLLPGIGSLTVKLRDDKIETKRNELDYGVQTWSANVTGRCVHWHKWSFTLKESLSTGHLAPDENWVTVSKVRELRKIGMAADGTISDVPIDTRVDHGCVVELTDLTICDQKWWSLCYEAFGAVPRLRSVLDASISHMVGDGSAAPTLTEQDSLDYAPWLAKLFPAGNRGDTQTPSGYHCHN